VEVTVDARTDGTAVVHLAGRLDLLSASAVKDRFATAVGEGFRRLVVDLHEVPFMDSSGLSALIVGLKATRLAGGDLRIARPGEQIAMILELTSLNRILGAYDSIEEALAAF
jgi:anti-sigma B factor antagonist